MHPRAHTQRATAPVGEALWASPCALLTGLCTVSPAASVSPAVERADGPELCEPLSRSGEPKPDRPTQVQPARSTGHGLGCAPHLWDLRLSLGRPSELS